MSASEAGWTRPCFSRPAETVLTVSAGGTPRPPNGFGPCIQRPYALLVTFGVFPARLGAPDRRPNSGQTSPAPAAANGWRSGQFGTLLGATGGDPNTLAPNR